MAAKDAEAGVWPDGKDRGRIMKADMKSFLLLHKASIFCLPTANFFASFRFLLLIRRARAFKTELSVLLCRSPAGVNCSTRAKALDPVLLRRNDDGDGDLLMAFQNATLSDNSSLLPMLDNDPVGVARLGEGSVSKHTIERLFPPGDTNAGNSASGSFRSRLVGDLVV